MKFTIETDLTNEGTIITVDGQKLNDSMKLSAISFMAEAPNKRYGEDDGWISLSIQSFDEEGNVKRENYGKDKTINENVKPLGLMEDSEMDQKDMIRYFGDPIKTEKEVLVDSIIQYCVDNKMSHPATEILLERSVDSLQDKLADLGITSDSI